MITSVFETLVYGTKQIFTQESIILTFQGNKIIKSNIPIEPLYGVVLANLEEGMGTYYIILCNNSIHNIDHLTIDVINKLIHNRELVGEFDSLKLAIEAAIL